MDRDTLWLWLSSSEGMGPATANDLWTELCERGLSLEDFYELGAEEWVGQFGLNARVVKGLAERRARINDVVELADSLRENAYGLVSLESSHYPASLKTTLRRGAPPLLYALGNVELLGRNAIAVVGSRDASPRGLTIARALGQSAARAGLVLVSGGAKGIDSASHLGSLEAGGATVVVLSCGILRYRPASELGEQADPQSTLYVSELDPNMTWQVGGAMARNRIVCGLASAVIVVEAKETGGTMDAAKKAAELHKPVFVVQFDSFDAHSSGNAVLLRKGARAMPAQYDPTSDAWQADLAPVLASGGQAMAGDDASHQMDLFSS